MTPEEIQLLFPNASQDFIAANNRRANLERAGDIRNDSSRHAPKLERHSRHGTLGKSKVQKAASRSFLVRVTSVRARLLDEDNLCEKYHVDLLRYAGIISGDKASQAKIETSQRKIQKGEEPHTLIQVFEML